MKLKHLLASTSVFALAFAASLDAAQAQEMAAANSTPATDVTPALATDEITNAVDTNGTDFGVVDAAGATVTAAEIDIETDAVLNVFSTTGAGQLTVTNNVEVESGVTLTLKGADDDHTGTPGGDAHHRGRRQHHQHRGHDRRHLRLRRHRRRGS